MDSTPFVEVRLVQRFSAPADRVFNAWVDPAVAGQWLFATAMRPAARVTIDARAGGSFCFVEQSHDAEIAHAGEYLEIARPRRLAFTLPARKRSNDLTRVIVDIAPVETGCELTLLHASVPPDLASRVEGRWAGMLYGLGTILSQW